ncbi:bactericidal permeability-increasing protein-like [Pelodytes ibericus]
MDMSHTLALTLLSALCLVSEAGNPGFVVRLTQTGLDYARQQGMIVLQQQLAKIHLPDFSGSTHVKHLGKVKYSFHGMAVRSFQIPSSQISLVPGVGLKLTISGAFIQVDGQWKISYHHLSSHGGFDLKVEQLSISTGLKLGSDASGRPTITPSDCSNHIGDIKVHIAGKFGWLVDIFHHSIDKELRKSFEKQICPIVSESITAKLQPFLQTLPVTAKIDKVAAIDYSMIGPPSVTAEFLDVQLKGEFFIFSNRTTPPFSPPALSLPVDHSLMVYFGVSDYLFNTAGFVYQSAGKLDVAVTDDMIPKDFSIRLKTSAFGTLIPQISKMYPNMLMKLKISSTASPYLTITLGNLTISPVMKIDAFAILPNTSLAPLFVLNVTTTALVKVGVIAGRIVGNLDLSRVQMSLIHSDVGPFPVTILDLAINYYTSHILLPKINNILNKGYPLPLLDHIQLTDVVLKPSEHYVLFGANVHYE